MYTLPLSLILLIDVILQPLRGRVAAPEIHAALFFLRLQLLLLALIHHLLILRQQGLVIRLGTHQRLHQLLQRLPVYIVADVTQHIAHALHHALVQLQHEILELGLRALIDLRKHLAALLSQLDYTGVKHLSDIVVALRIFVVQSGVDGA